MGHEHQEDAQSPAAKFTLLAVRVNSTMCVLTLAFFLVCFASGLNDVRDCDVYLYQPYMTLAMLSTALSFTLGQALEVFGHKHQQLLTILSLVNIIFGMVWGPVTTMTDGPFVAFRSSCLDGNRLRDVVAMLGVFFTFLGVVFLLSQLGVWVSRCCRRQQQVSDAQAPLMHYQ